MWGEGKAKGKSRDFCPFILKNYHLKNFALEIYTHPIFGSSYFASGTEGLKVRDL